jgi:hypothetical protein
MVPAWGCLVVAIELLPLPLPALAAVHLVLALATWRVWLALGRPALAAERAGWLALAVPFTGALAAACFPARAARHVAEPIEPQGEPMLTPADRSPDPAPHRGIWTLVPILKHGTLEQRLGAVRALKALEGPDGVTVLRSMLTDPDHQVVLLASLALAELEADYETALRAGRDVGVLRRYLESGLAPEAVAPGLWREVLERATEPADRAAALLALGDARAALDAAGQAPEAAQVRREALYRLGHGEVIDA